ncbi:MAG: 4Fe-4S dicluster domain-containing protein [Bdellovibrionota bacterium]
MELTPPVNNIRTQLCVLVTGARGGLEREYVWPAAAEEFLKKVNKLGIQILVVGPKPVQKFGSKKTIRYMERHEVVGTKLLEASRSHRIELRVLNPHTRAWSRVRTDACVVVGPHGVWPKPFEGWTSQGTLTLNALARWFFNYKWVPGHDFAFLGSSNQVFRWAIRLLDNGAKSCFIIESSNQLNCWRAYRDRFIAKGGRILPNHAIRKVSSNGKNSLELFLDNDQGTLILKADTLVLSPVNSNALNDPSKWKEGLYYVHRRSLPGEIESDEESWLEVIDWREVYWRVARQFDLVDHGEAEGALKVIRQQRREYTNYRKPELRRELHYSGKILDRKTLSALQTSSSAPRSFAHPKPMASLECFEKIPCRACADACPENAIEITQLLDEPRLIEDRCTGCGACVVSCPAGAAVMVRELPEQQKARYFLPENTQELWKAGTFVTLLNRKGDTLGTGRVVGSASYERGLHRLLEIESTNVHLWEARNFKLNTRPETVETDGAFGKQVSTQVTKRGWITLNGSKRLCPTGVPVTVALWKLGIRRFEEALFCYDGGCRLCEIRVNGKQVLACRTVLEEGDTVEVNSPKQSVSKPLCPCKGTTPEEFNGHLAEGTPESLVCEVTGVGNGTCHGRWCLASEEMASKEKLRPNFHGYRTSPWRDLWADDVIVSPNADSDSLEEEDR